MSHTSVVLIIIITPNINNTYYYDYIIVIISIFDDPLILYMILHNIYIIYIHLRYIATVIRQSCIIHPLGDDSISFLLGPFRPLASL